ncbi:MAG: hypothetical protein H8E39_01990 [Alphaproteobacteria bacterium]|nr:hypothetical protein [Alphaproteobacteria bacterium]
MAKKRKYPFRPPLKRNQYEAIGQVTVQWAYLDTEICHTILFILNVLDKGNARKIKPAELDLIGPFKTKVNQLKALYAETFNEKAINHGVNLLDQALNLKGHRDHIVHGSWESNLNEYKEISDDISATLLKFSRSPSARTMNYRTPKTRGIASKISKLNRDLAVFHRVVVRGQPPASPGEYHILSHR